MEYQQNRLGWPVTAASGVFLFLIGVATGLLVAPAGKTDTPAQTGQLQQQQAIVAPPKQEEVAVVFRIPASFDMQVMSSHAQGDFESYKAAEQAGLVFYVDRGSRLVVINRPRQFGQTPLVQVRYSAPRPNDPVGDFWVLDMNLKPVR